MLGATDAMGIDRRAFKGFIRSARPESYKLLYPVRRGSKRYLILPEKIHVRCRQNTLDRNSGQGAKEMGRKKIKQEWVVMEWKKGKGAKKKECVHCLLLPLLLLLLLLLLR